MNAPTDATPAAPPAVPRATGKLLEVLPDGMIVLGVPGTDYRLHLAPTAPLSVKAGAKVSGVVAAEALRVDVVPAGGRFIEPTYGRPRRVQGRVLAADPATRTITVAAGVPIVCTLTDARQQPADFPPGTLVSFDVRSGATIALR